VFERKFFLKEAIQMKDKVLTAKVLMSKVAMGMGAIAKKLALYLVGAVLFLGLVQPAVQAAPADMQTSPNPSMSAESLEQKRADRREIQSRASEAADTEESANSVGEVLKEKLNLNEIVEDNEIVDGMKQVLDSKDTK
jgi:type IV secretory pathway VirB6-like protein